MSERTEGGEGTLQIGLLSVDRRKLLSPIDDRPELFSASFHGYPSISVESEARATLARQGIITSSQHLLRGTPDGVHKGYLLRESSKVDLGEHGLTLFTTHQLNEFIRDEDPQTVSGHFLRQIVKYMS